MRRRNLPILFLIIGLASLPFSLRAEPTSENNERLKRALQQFPAADSDKDGVLTESEARAYLKKMTGGKAASPGKQKDIPANQPAPTLADVKYGAHERNVLDFWKAKSDRPTPVVVFIHGGGFTAGDKSKIRGDRLIQQCLDAGISFAAINYRFRTTAPIQDILRDCARAIQFIRFKAGEWNVDKRRIASYGGSAGAGTSLWLAFHDDLADPGNSDPVLRESTRIICAGALATQFSYDLLEWEKVFGNDLRKFQQSPNEVPSFYGMKDEDALREPAGVKVRKDCDMCSLITRDDPPVFLNNPMPDGAVKDRGHLLHHPKHAQLVYDRCREVGVGAVALIPGLGIQPAKDQPQDLREFLFQHLQPGPTAAE